MVFGIWVEFETTFDRKYITDTIYDLKRYELLNMEQGSMSATEYEQHFVLLATFVVDMHLLDNMLAKMFEECLSLRIRDKVSMQRLRKHKDVLWLL